MSTLFLPEYFLTPWRLGNRALVLMMIPLVVFLTAMADVEWVVSPSVADAGIPFDSTSKVPTPKMA